MRQGKEFKGRQFTAEVILWAVRWYLMFPISYRDLELMLQVSLAAVVTESGDTFSVTENEGAPSS